MKKQSKKEPDYNYGLVLSGGSARGFVHLGVLKAMEEANLLPEVISGASAGAIVGAFYADGYKPEEILELFIEKKLFHLIHLNVNRLGFLIPSGINDLLKQHLRAKTFSDLNLPLYVAASDLNRGVPVYFNEGSLRERVMASAAIPLLFQPVVIDGTTYADGGLLDNLPVQPIRDQCRKIIGVSANPHFEEEKLTGFWKLVERTIYLIMVSRIQVHRQDCDIFIEPKGMKDYGFFEINKAAEMFDLGYKEAKKLLK